MSERQSGWDGRNKKASREAITKNSINYITDGRDCHVLYHDESTRSAEGVASRSIAGGNEGEEMREAWELYFMIMGFAATLGMAALCLFFVIGFFGARRDEYRKELCTYCGRMIRLDEPVDNEGRCCKCKNGVDEYF